MNWKNIEFPCILYRTECGKFRSRMQVSGNKLVITSLAKFTYRSRNPTLLRGSQLHSDQKALYNFNFIKQQMFSIIIFNQSLKTLTYLNGQMSRNFNIFDEIDIIINNFQSHPNTVKCLHNIINVFRVSDVLPTYFTSLQASKITTKHEKRRKYSHVSRDKRVIPGLSLTYKISTIC